MTLEELKEKYEKLKGDLRGNVIQFPHQFLEEENLMKNFYYRELFVPEITFI